MPERNSSRCRAAAPQVLALLILPLKIGAQPTADPGLQALINGIRAVDNHAHPAPLLGEGEVDNQLDPVSIEQFEAFPLPLRLREDNVQYIGAWRHLYGYAYNDMTEAHRRELTQAKRRVMREKGDSYPAWVLDKLGIEVMLANRVSLGRGLSRGRFAFVPYVDALMLPLDNRNLGRENPDHRAYYTGVTQVLKRWEDELKVSAAAGSLDGYLKTVVTPVLERHKREGSPAIKFEAAYMRSLQFQYVSEKQASDTYARYVKGGNPPDAEYKGLQDYLFRYIAREAGRLGLAVHLHTGFGAGSYFEVRGSNPVLLESALNDKSLRPTNFVLVHGGWPFTKEVAALFARPNVYADFSAQAFFMSSRDLSEVLRNWLTMFPEKVLFGTDTFGTTPEIGWEEVGWLTAKTGREALALALTRMIEEGQVTRDRAIQLARGVMRDNALKLYKLHTN